MGLFSSNNKQQTEQDKGLQELTLSLHLSDFLADTDNNKTLSVQLKMLEELGSSLSSIKDNQELEVNTQSHNILKVKRVNGVLKIID